MQMKLFFVSINKEYRISLKFLNTLNTNVAHHEKIILFYQLFLVIRN